MALKVTLHWRAHWCNLSRSLLIFFAESFGLVTVSNSVVSSANWCMGVSRLSEMSLTYIRNSSGPRIDP
jgi:hypothetical protein